MVNSQEIIQLVVAWTLTGALVFTVIITCASMPGWIEFKDKKQQEKLFLVLIVELVAAAVGFFTGLLKFSPSAVQNSIGKNAVANFQEEQASRVLTPLRTFVASFMPDKSIDALQEFAPRTSLRDMPQAVAAKTNELAAQLAIVDKADPALIKAFENYRMSAIGLTQQLANPESPIRPSTSPTTRLAIDMTTEPTTMPTTGPVGLNWNYYNFVEARDNLLDEIDRAEGKGTNDGVVIGGMPHLRPNSP